MANFDGFKMNNGTVSKNGPSVMSEEVKPFTDMSDSISGIPTEQFKSLSVSRFQVSNIKKSEQNCPTLPNESTLKKVGSENEASDCQNEDCSHKDFSQPFCDSDGCLHDVCCDDDCLHEMCSNSLPTETLNMNIRLETGKVDHSDDTSICCTGSCV